MSKIRRDIIWTMLSQGLVAGAIFLQYWIVRSFWGLDAFGQFSLIFRVRSALEWVVLLQIPLALARVISVTEVPERRWRIAAVGLVGGCALVGTFGAVALSWPGAAAAMLLGGGRYASWVGPLCALLFSYSVYLLGSAVLRGVFAFSAANIMNVMALAVVPCVTLLLARDLDVRDAVTRSALASAGVSVVILLLAARHLVARGIVARGQASGINVKEVLRELISFGTPRLLTVLFSGGFTVALPWLLARDGHAEALAALNGAMALLVGSTLLTAPISFVLLPILSRNLAEGRTATAKEQLHVLLSAIAFMSVAASLGAVGFLGDVMRILIGERLSADSFLILAIAFILPLFLFIDVIRAPIDAASVRPLNAVTYLVGGCVTVASYVLLNNVLTASSMLVCSLALVSGYCAAGASGLLLVRELYGGWMLRSQDLYMLAAWLFVMCGCVASTLLCGSAEVVNRWIAAAALVLLVVSALVMKPVWFRLLLTGNPA